MDGANNLYVALDVQGTHPGSGTYDSVNVYTSSASFTWTYTGFYQPNGLALDTAGNLYVADTGNKTVELWSPLGSFTNSPSFSFNANNSLVNPVAVAVDSTNEVYVADSGNNTIYNFAP